ncbi:aspartate dehydrogenase [Halomonas sp. V046]|uniref:aspartate dehydrogenase n=1 Tax=Halomonas sp. V046 TaxID=3459611 RepID=UPI004043B47F
MNNRMVKKIAFIGMGAMGKKVVTSLQTKLDGTQFAFLEKPERTSAHGDEILAQGFKDIDALLDWMPDLVVECAGHEAVRELVPVVIERGINVVIASIGALSDSLLLANLNAAVAASGAKITLVSGAIGGLDALRGGMLSAVDSVIYEGRKPPAAWLGTPAEDAYDLMELTEETLLFEGNANDAARSYPKNANVTAAVALSGIGFDATQVKLIADPNVTENSHSLHVYGAFGEFFVVLKNNPLPENPRTSWLAALSVEEAVLRETGSIVF